MPEKRNKMFCKVSELMKSFRSVFCSWIPWYQIFQWKLLPCFFPAAGNPQHVFPGWLPWVWTRAELQFQCSAVGKL